jgi:hypothetical protein
VSKKSSVGKAEWPIRELVIEPERSRGTVVNINIGKRTVRGKLIVDNLPEVAIATGDSRIRGRDIT